MGDFDNMDGSAPQDEEDGGGEDMVQDVANVAPGGPPGLGGEWDEEIEYIANNIDVFGDDLIALVGDGDWLADVDTLMPPSPGGMEQGMFSSDATSSSVTMSSVPESVTAQPPVLSGSLSGDNDAVAFTPADVAVATTFISDGDHGTLNMPSASEPPTVSSRAVPETTVAEIAASDPSKFICNVPSSVEVPVACVSPSGGVSKASKTRAAAISRYLAKKKRRRWDKKSPSYKSRQQVANSRPRHRGRFLPLQSEFVPIAELQRRQRVLMKEIQEREARPSEN